MRPSSNATADLPGPTCRSGHVLLRSSSDRREPVPCPPGEEDTERRLLVVSLSGDAEARVAAIEACGGLPEEVAVLTAGETRSAAAASTAPGPTTARGGTELSWATVSSAADLSGIGVKIDRCLSSWSDGPPVQICFDSVSALLKTTDLPTVFRFLHVLMRRIDAADAVAHYHLDPSVHGQRTVSTIETLFEAVREYDETTDRWVDA
jgi:hypothetical protein